MALQVPLRSKSGPQRYVLVDESESWVLAHKWFLSAGYPACKLEGGGGKQEYMHRLLCPTLPGFIVDHINGNKLDNRRENLRPGTRAMNQQNRHKILGRSTYRGVHYFKGGSRIKRWAAEARVDGKKHRLGYFLTEEEAGAAAAEFRARHMPGSQEALAQR